MSTERYIIWSAEALCTVEGKTCRAATVRGGRAPRCLRTQARTYAQHWDLGELYFAPESYRGRGRKEVIRTDDERSEAVG